MVRKGYIAAGVVAVLLIIIIVVASRRVSTATSSGEFHLPINGEAPVNAVQTVYAWPAGVAPPASRSDALQACESDPRCAAVMYVSPQQQAARLGKTDGGYCSQSPTPPECVASAYPVQLLSGQQVGYVQADQKYGPTLHVRSGYKFALLQ